MISCKALIVLASMTYTPKRLQTAIRGYAWLLLESRRLPYALEMAKKLNPVNVRLDDEMREELKKIAQAENRTLSNLIVTVLREYLERRTKAPRS